MDKVNASFLFVAAGFYYLNVRRLIQDEEIKGYSPVSICFFSAWNIWNAIYFNFGADMFWSGISSVLVAILNVVYLYYLLKFRKKS